ncbi:alanine racemase [Burkholderiaceae bacterium FT117]|uniref:alanine racemase n=1 Tax=Zeimonas sediminis TaxID=2944268 RepID=UPI002342F8CB|nr:alanine racemase [Zeimonas sediminis]MCM5569144.1 alanine racemase [Zeimonas sediminis]
MSRPISAIVSVAAMRHNLARARALAPGARAWAVVKANAYGHGLAAALEGFADADGMALVEFDKAARLREAGWQRPILMLEGAFDPQDVAQARRDRLALVVHEPRQLDWLAAASPAAPIDVHLKFNSGMNRLGFDAAGLREAHARLSALPGIGSITLVTHFANSDLPGGADDAIARFERACAGLPGQRSLANSAAVLAVPDAHRDWVRPGIMLYGASPFADRSAAECGLRPAMKLASRLIAVQRLAPGDSVGYGSTFTATRPMRIGVVACGYADGYPRHAPSGTPVAVAGRRTGTVGRVSMDMLCVDLEPVPGASPGDEVELWGGGLVDIDEVAQAAGTIGYELMCALAPRVPLVVDRAGA